MYLDKCTFYQIVYSMKSTLSDICAMAEKMYMLDNGRDKEICMEEIRRSVNEFSCFQLPEPENEGFAGNISNLRMSDTKALVIDDNAADSYLIKAILGNFDIHSDVAVNGHDGIEMLKNSNYDIVFINYKTPDMDGIEIVEEIAGMANGDERLIIGMAENIVPEFNERLNSLGIEIMLRKPVSQEQIGFILSKELPDKALFDFTS